MLILNQELKESYLSIFNACRVNADSLKQANGIVQKISASRPRYESVSAILTIPWYVIAVIHNLEAGLNFNCHLHNGDPLTSKTVHVPSGRQHQVILRIAGDERHRCNATGEFGCWTDWSLSGISYKLGDNGIVTGHTIRILLICGKLNMCISTNTLRTMYTLRTRYPNRSEEWF
jgi:lysozyme family protein